MGLSITSNPSSTQSKTHKTFLFTNYILIAASSICIFLTLSLRLVPSLAGFFLILLHAFTIAFAIMGCNASLHGAHMVATVLTAIFQGSVAVLIFTRTSDFLESLKSYVNEENGAVILRLAGGLCGAVFCLEWVVLTLAFFLKYYAERDGGNGNGNGIKGKGSKVQHQEDDLSNWPWPFQV